MTFRLPAAAFPAQARQERYLGRYSGPTHPPFPAPLCNVGESLLMSQQRRMAHVEESKVSPKRKVLQISPKEHIMSGSQKEHRTWENWKEGLTAEQSNWESCILPLSWHLKRETSQAKMVEHCPGGSLLWKVLFLRRWWVLLIGMSTLGQQGQGLAIGVKRGRTPIRLTGILLCPPMAIFWEERLISSYLFRKIGVMTPLILTKIKIIYFP